MSEYQYYHFQALDKPLTKQQMAELRDISTRARITPGSFTNTYNWGDLKADPERLMWEYFDIHEYTANWMYNRLMIKVPVRVVDLKAVRRYCCSAFSVRVRGGNVLLDFNAEGDAEYDEYNENEGGTAFAPLRADIMNGDLRPFYIAWLCDPAHDEDDVEPPLPAGMKDVSALLQEFARFMFVDEWLLAAAGEGSGPAQRGAATRDDAAQWIAGLRQDRKDGVLVSLLDRESGHAELAALRTDFMAAWRKSHKPQTGENVKRRTYGKLFDVRNRLVREENERLARKREKERLERERREGEERNRYLSKLAEREPAAWKKVGELLKATVPKNYDEAVSLLKDLRDVSLRANKDKKWEAKVAKLRSTYSRRSSLMRRFDEARFR